MALAAWVAGTAWVQVQAGLPEWTAALLAAAAALAVAGLARRAGTPRLAAIAACAAAFAMGTGWAAWRAEVRLADALDPAHENLVTRVVLQVAALPVQDARGQRFVAHVLSAPVAGVPRRILVSWYDAPPGRVPARAPRVVPGEVYSAALVLRRPHGARNPHAFDYAAWMLERGLRAGATVRGEPVLLRTQPWASPGIAVQRVRHELRERMRARLGDARWGPVVLALALGDQAGVHRGDWDVFARTGITHLVSISGLHVTLLAGMAGLAALAAVKRMSWRGTPLAERAPAQLVAGLVALGVALAYCLVAGWGVPARRTFLMLAVVVVAGMARLPLAPSAVLALAAAVVVLLDPWAALAPGFWLSFGAVAVLMLAGSGRWRLARAPRPLARLGEAARLQAAITVALVPPLALQFQEVSLISPLANAVAIPLVSLVATPLALAGMVAAAVPGLDLVAGGVLWAAERAVALVMWPVGALAGLGWASVPVAATPWPLAVLAIGGVAWGLMPPGLPGRHAAWLLVAPVFLHAPPRPAAGDWRLAALDVGQGGAAVIETARHVVVFDTGPPYGETADAGERVVWPYLRARGIGRVDDLVVSHADVDHAGGAAALLDRTAVARTRASYRIAPTLGGRGVVYAPCAAGQAWQLDGVTFRFLHPVGRDDDPVRRRDPNGHSCVMRLEGVRHAALLPGDAGARQEALLADDRPAELRADVVFMGHHGSRTSSSPAFVRATGAAHAVAQAGHLSRFGHPHPEVVARWERAGSRVHRTDRDGAVVFVSGPGGLRVTRQREAAARYWDGR